MLTIQLKSQNFQGVLCYEIKTYTKLKDTIISGLDTFEIHINEHLFSYRYFKDNRRFIVDYKKLLIYSFEEKKAVIEKLDTTMPESFSGFEQGIIEKCKDDSISFSINELYTQFRGYSKCGSYFVKCLKDSSLEINQMYLNQTDPYGEYAKFYRNKIIKELDVEYFGIINARYLLISIQSQKANQSMFKLPRRKYIWHDKKFKFVKFKN
ncbi:MAG: hypothetical protein Q8K70_05665 [Bacteroidota bacterium]|nr:hypothetical protein [Bacteroidota bacterium]